MTGTLPLFNAAVVEETESHGHRTTPAHVVKTLWSLPEFQEGRGPTLDLGCGDGTIALGLAALDSYPIEFAMVDIRPSCPQPTADPPWGHVAWFDAAKPWPSQDIDVLSPAEQVVSNPPWARQHCTACGQTWDADSGTHCQACSVYGPASSGRGALIHKAEGQDLAQVMVSQAMRVCTNAEIWVIHTTDWRFHEQRARFFLNANYERCTRPETHAVAGITDIAERVAWGDPSARGPVRPHNKMASFYHFAPSARAPEQPYHRMLDRWVR